MCYDVDMGTFKRQRGKGLRIATGRYKLDCVLEGAS